jgi:YVTN family beta-propeller protein
MTSSTHPSNVLGTIFVLALALICSSCGDVYRPVAQVIPGTPPNPAAVHFVIAVSTNGNNNIGSASRLDVSGDTNLGVLQTGQMPMHAALLQNASKQYIANYGDDIVTENAPSSPTTTSTISLAPGAKPVFVHTTENNNVYVANYGDNTVSVINAASNVVTTSVPVGSHPVALAEMPNAQKLYVANQGSNSVSVINVVDDTVGATIGLGAAPVWMVARSDNARIYVLDNGGTVSAIDTLSDTVISSTASAGAGANFMALDSKAQRLFVTNPQNKTLSIFDISEANPSTPPVNPVVAPIDLSQGVSPAYIPISVTGIGDGSRAYVASYQLATCGTSPGIFPCINNSVAVINVGNNTVTKFVPISSGIPVDAGNQDGCGGTAAPAAPWTPGTAARFRMFAVSSGGGSTSNFKVYVGQCDAQNVAVIDTFPANSNPADTFAGVSIPSALSAFPGQQVSISAASQTAATSTTPATTTYAYALTSGSGLQLGMSIFVSGMTDVGNNGNFVISALGSGTFTVANPSGVTNSTQSGVGAVLPRQNPVFMLAGP